MKLYRQKLFGKHTYSGLSRDAQSDLEKYRNGLADEAEKNGREFRNARSKARKGGIAGWFTRHKTGIKGIDNYFESAANEYAENGVNDAKRSLDRKTREIDKRAKDYASEVAKRDKSGFYKYGFWKKLGGGALLTAGLGGLAYGGKKLYDWKKERDRKREEQELEDKEPENEQELEDEKRDRGNSEDEGAAHGDLDLV